ncbi:hypothetical protein [Rummeliibacillus stabekisii]|uniref:Uncharacterized protein n=1 Tax=Rummeliibacillus stabekisii TaxID=241244 RepID=A0A143HEA6_9BACL|nr:hypothetical protein [Rummeliibacillus stabekisii]AMW99769.1 hypothetical protein ATY39_10160 [Rummeliibacillus stabekisii]
MKNFRTLDQAKKDLIVIKQYIDLVESYEPITNTQQIIHTYALLGSIQKTAELMSEIGNIISTEEVTTHITSRPAPDDLLHKLIKSLYRKRARKTR